MGTHKRRANKVPVLVIRDEASKWIMAYCIEKRGPVDCVVDTLVRDIAELGYGGCKIAVKTDQEASIVALRDAVIAKRTAPTVPKFSVRKDPQSHGEIEVAVKTWAGQFRTLKCHVEGATGKFLPIGCPATTWLAKWAANTINLFRVQPHGLTAHQAVGGRKCDTPVCPFGEHVQWKVQSDSVNSRKAESEWYDGIYLGIRPISGESIIGTTGGITYCRTPKRVIDEDMWSMRGITDVPHCARDVEGDRNAGMHPGRGEAPVLVSRYDHAGHGGDSKPDDVEPPAPAESDRQTVQWAHPTQQVHKSLKWEPRVPVNLI